MRRPRPLPVFGPPDQWQPDPSMPVLGVTPGDVVAILAQYFELAGQPVALTDTTRPDDRNPPTVRRSLSPAPHWPPALVAWRPTVTGTTGPSARC